MTSTSTRRSLTLPRIRLALAALLVSAILPACNASLWMEDGIPSHGVSSTTTIIGGHVRTVVAWGEDGHGYRFEWRGEGMPGITEGDSDFELLGDGDLSLAEYESGSRVVVVRLASSGGQVSREFERDGVIAPFQPEGAAWLAEAMPTVIATMGLGAETRVPRLHAAGGLDAVLEDITLRETDVARVAYYEFVAASAAFSSDEVARSLEHASSRVDSDAHLSDLLEDAIEARPGDRSVIDGILAASPSIDSDAHLTDVLETVVEEGGVQGEQLATLLEVAARSIDSDAHLADLLETIVDRGDLGDISSSAFLEALGSIQSDAHAVDVIEELVEGTGLPPETLALLLSRAGSQIASDAHLADLLEDVPRVRLSDAGVRRAFVEALSSVQSDAHAADVLEEFVQTGDPDVLADLIDAATAGIASDAHLADVLEEVPASALGDARVQAAMRAAVDSIGSDAHRDSVLRRFPDGALAD